MKILLLEDDKTLHESLKAYLKMEKFEVLSAFCAADVYLNAKMIKHERKIRNLLWIPQYFIYLRVCVFSYF